MRNQRLCQFVRLLFATCLCASALTAGGSTGARPPRGAYKEEQQEREPGARQGRLRPPGGLPCDVNHTTSFTGRITAYSRTTRRILIRVRTDEQTTEQFTIRLRRGEEASKKFLFQGEAFRPVDWKKIERARGLLKPGMRAIIWACRDDQDDFHAELIDWRPNEGGGSFVL
jgi:hypothetical protein